MVLNRKEKALLNIVYKTAVNKNGQCLLTPLDILQKIPYKLEFTENDLDKVLNDLALDDYFTVDKAKHHGEIVYVLALKEKGLSYIRDKKKARKKTLYQNYYRHTHCHYVIYNKMDIGQNFLSNHYE